MVRVLTSAALAAAIVCAAPAWAEKKKKPSVGIFVDFDASPAPMAMAAMKREVGAIMRPTGLGVDWRQLSENKGTEAFAGLVVVRFKGRCHARPWVDEAEPGKVALGHTIVQEGHVLPFTEINCEQVRKTLPYLGTHCDHERQNALGRALGRVVAHELYHALARTTEHTGKGLGRATQSLRDLVTGTLRFSPDDSEAIRRGVIGPPATFSFGPSHQHKH
jgi:hypothetical protein